MNALMGFRRIIGRNKPLKTGSVAIHKDYFEKINHLKQALIGFTKTIGKKTLQTGSGANHMNYWKKINQLMQTLMGF